MYVRQSRDKNGDGLAVARQEQQCRALCAARGWKVVRVLSDNDTSATAASRPGYKELTGIIQGRLADVVVVWAVDRLVRRLADLESVISDCETAGVKMATVSGDLDLSTDQGRLVGRILASVARGEMERKAARQAAASRQAAELGAARKACPRPFGWLPDRVTMHPTEGPAVAAAARALLAGCTLTGICREWDKAGLRPPRAPFGPARPWNRRSITTIMRNPRIAGISVYKGTEIGTGKWDALVPEGTFRAVVKLLDDPSRAKQQGVRRMLGGLAECTCGNKIIGSQNGLGQPTYRCHQATRNGRPGPHATVRSEPIDWWIGEVVIERLSRPDAAVLLRKDDSGRAVVLRDEAQAIRSRLKSLGADHVQGKITLDDVRSGRAWGDARLAEINAELAELGRESALAPLLAADDARAAWGKLSIDRRRAVVAALMKVILHPAGRGTKVFNPESVKIEWRTQTT